VGGGSHTTVVILDSRKFKGHLLISSSSIGGGGGFHSTKYGMRAYAPPKNESIRNSHTGTLLLELYVEQFINGIELLCFNTVQILQWTNGYATKI
jgi:hypothetical protein